MNKSNTKHAEACPDDPRGRRTLERLVSWINRLTSPEGCTARDARVLRSANHILASRLNAREVEVIRLKGELEELKRRETGQ